MVEVSAREYSSPLISNANLMPQKKRWEALGDSLEARVHLVRNTKKPNARIQGYANEFVKLVVPIVGEGIPFDLDTTAEMLDKPSQKIFMKQVWESMDSRERRLIEGFLKNEPTNKAGRIISSFADFSFIWKFSCFTLAFRNAVLHSEENSGWFCPGLTPRQIADKVVEYVGTVEEPCEGDFSNFDGLVSDYLQRHVINACYLRFFHAKHHDELRQYLNMLISCPARAKLFHFRYDAGVGVKSGSPTTCDGNSILNAFLQYCSIRMTDNELEPAMAFRLIGLAFGDDSLFDRRFSRNFAKVAKMVGMDLKIEYYQREKGLTFLARVFIDPYTTNSTIQDPLRTWRKLHITTRDPSIPLADAAIDRVDGYLIIDAITPITSDYCEMIKRVYTPQCNDHQKRLARKSVDREKSYWSNDTENKWPQALQDIELMFKVISARVGLDQADLRELQHKLRTSNSAWFSTQELDEDSPYKGTLDPDGQIPAAGVDMRTHENGLKRNRENALDKSRTKNRGPGSCDDRATRSHRIGYTDDVRTSGRFRARRGENDGVGRLRKGKDKPTDRKQASGSNNGTDSGSIRTSAVGHQKAGGGKNCARNGTASKARQSVELREIRIEK